MGRKEKVLDIFAIVALAFSMIGYVWWIDVVYAPAKTWLFFVGLFLSLGSGLWIMSRIEWFWDREELLAKYKEIDENEK